MPSAMTRLGSSVLVLIVFQSLAQAFQLAMSTNPISEPSVSANTNAAKDGNLKLIVCQGSSCEGRCRGMFNPKTELLQLVQQYDRSDIDIEEVNCMNMCKKGPNVRMVLDGEVVTMPQLMNDIEQRRKAFTGIGGDPGIQRVWTAAEGLLGGAVDFERHGPPAKD